MTEAQAVLSLQGPRAPLTMEPISYSSGIPTRYRVLGLPKGQTAEIALRHVRSAAMWKIRFGQAGRYSGSYRSDDEALAAIQANRK